MVYFIRLRCLQLFLVPIRPLCELLQYFFTSLGTGLEKRCRDLNPCHAAERACLAPPSVQKVTAVSI